MSDHLSDGATDAVRLTDDARACAVALASLPAITPHRLRRLLARHTPASAVRVARGELHDPLLADLAELGASHGWSRLLEQERVHDCLESMRSAWIDAVVLGEPHYPAVLADDPEAPAVLFWRGSLEVLHRRRVGIVGTRSATAGALRFADLLGAALSERGVSVVSGLARGIDGAAHRGALRSVVSAPVAVVASGLDVVYPREHRQLWDDVASRGLLVAERPPGATPVAHGFPARNRVLAALSEVLVVVESRTTGGSLITAREALKRDVTVMALPGSVASRASEGTNQLLRDGVASVVLDVDDVLIALGLDTRRSQGRRFDPRPCVSVDERSLLDLLGADAVTVDELVLRSGRPLVEVATSLGRLEAGGHVERSGGWFVAVAP